MSHFTCLVIGQNVEEQLEQFNENTEMPDYIRSTKAELIAESRKEIEEYRDSGFYAQYMTNPEEYIKDCHQGHINYVTKRFPNEVLPLLNDDNALWEYAVRHHKYDDGNYDDEIDDEGNLHSTRNPNSQWDWYELGGRWAGFYRLKDGGQGAVGSPGLMTPPAEAGAVDSAMKKDILPEDLYKSTFAIIKDGKWYEKGKMGWWACVSNEKDQEVWDAEFRKMIDELPDDALLSVYDLHI